MEAPIASLKKVFQPASEREPASTQQDGAPLVDATTADTVDKDVNAPVVDKDVNAPVEHETIKREHEDKEKTVIDKERHQDHYHTTVQPVKDKEVVPEEHKYEQSSEVRKFDHDNDEAKAKAESREAGFKDTSEEETHVEKTKEPTAVGEQVHHHVHETVQPVIEKETVVPTVTHKQHNVKEIHQDISKDEGVTVNPAMTAEEFKAQMGKQ